MNELHRILARQAAFQESLRDLPWPVKVRMVEQARKAIETLRKETARRPS